MNCIFESSNPVRVGLVEHLRPGNHKLALTAAGKSVSYHQMLEATIRLHQFMLTKNSQPKRIGILAYRSQLSYISTLLSVLCGASFVYLNPTFPQTRLQMVLDSAQLDMLIVDAQHNELVDDLMMARTTKPVIIREDEYESESVIDNDTLARYWATVHNHHALPDELAYIKFTSGSTGIPKGVPISYANLAAFLEYSQQRYQFTSDDVFSQTFDQSFDLSVFDIFLCFSAGGHLCIPSKVSLLAPSRYINEHRISVWFSVPSLANQMAARGFLKRESLPTLRLSLFCGEALPQQTAEAWQAAAPQSIVENLYGPTEATIACFVYRWQEETSKSICHHGIVPIGEPYPHVEAVIADETGQIVEAFNRPGRLLVRGSQVFQGYLNQESTQQPFVTVDMDDVPYYETGDVVSRQSDGIYLFHGRSDHQVKINGYRIELGEIEMIARQLIASNLAAIPFPSGAQAEKIVLFYEGQVDLTKLTALFQEKLPAYMCPKDMIALSALPLNANGKIDRKLLLAQLENERLNGVTA